MIDVALSFLQNKVNSHITAKSNGAYSVVLSSVVNSDGSIAIPPDSVGISLVNVEEERITKDQSYMIKNNDGTIVRRNPDLKLNLYVLFAINPSSPSVYPESLKLLSYVIGYFQSHTVFSHQDSPTLDAKIEKLMLDLYSFPIEQQHYMWATIGAKYLPSVVYRVRLVVIQENLAFDSGPATLSIKPNLQAS